MGIEPIDNSQGNRGIFNEGGAESGALTVGNANIDPELASLIDAWPTLPDAIRVGIMAMVRAGV